MLKFGRLHKFSINVINSISLRRKINIAHISNVSKFYDNYKCFTYIKLKPKVNFNLFHNVSVTSTFKSTDLLKKQLIGSWLIVCSGMVFIAVMLGGITRLTESGLSMVSWKFLGEKIPTNEISWIYEFEKYKQFPEFRMSNLNMTLEEFKKIWCMEYIHRMWGRLLGVVFIVPAIYFWMNNLLHSSIKKKIILLGFLISCQGFIGWYMVKSGLENDFSGPSEVPRVSQYRLAAHLCLAFIIFNQFLENALQYLLLKKSYTDNHSNVSIIQCKLHQLKQFKVLLYLGKSLVFLTAISGAFVAGLDAGLVYNSFPKMSSTWIPDDIFIMSPVLKNFTENPTTVQFIHRVSAATTLTVITGICLLVWKYKLSRRASTAAVIVLCVAYLQGTLGVCTLLNHVPISLAVLHQSGSLLLLSGLVWLSHEIKYIKKLPK